MLEGSADPQIATIIDHLLPHVVTNLDLSTSGRLSVSIATQDSQREVGRLVVSNCAWRVQSADDILVASGDTTDSAQPRLHQLLGRSVQYCRMRPATLDATFGFGELELRVFPFYTGPDPGYRYWTLWARVVGRVTAEPGPQLRFLPALPALHSDRRD